MLDSIPFGVRVTTSPGSTSLTNSAPTVSKAHVSDVRKYVLSLLPIQRGLKPNGSLAPISFLGLIVPHIARLLVGNSHKVLIPYTMLLGAFTLLLADTIGRTIAYPYEINAAVVMAVIGGPSFILLLRRSKTEL